MCEPSLLCSLGKRCSLRLALLAQGSADRRDLFKIGLDLLVAFRGGRGVRVRDLALWLDLGIFRPSEEESDTDPASIVILDVWNA
jgi:hypothetical protein